MSAAETPPDSPADPEAHVARARAELAAAARALEARLATERTRARAALVRRLHEVRRMLDQQLPASVRRSVVDAHATMREVIASRAVFAR